MNFFFCLVNMFKELTTTKFKLFSFSLLLYCFLINSSHISVDSKSQEKLSFKWKIENFSKLSSEKLYSDTFCVGGYKWKLLMFPKGNNVDQLSLYLYVADLANLPDGWNRYAEFSLFVINQLDNKYTIRKDTQHAFNAYECDWGYASLIALHDLYDTSRGYLLGDTCLIEAQVLVDRPSYALMDSGCEYDQPQPQPQPPLALWSKAKEIMENSVKELSQEAVEKGKNVREEWGRKILLPLKGN